MKDLIERLMTGAADDDLDDVTRKTMREAAQALQAAPEGGEVMCYGLRRKGSTAIVGIIPNKVAQKPATLEWFRENYEEVPLRLATPAPDTTSVSLCSKHGMYAKKGCADCDADIDMLTALEPPARRPFPDGSAASGRKVMADKDQVQP